VWGDLIQPQLPNGPSCGTFRSVKELVTNIDQFVQNDNRDAQPFICTAWKPSPMAGRRRWPQEERSSSRPHHLLEGDSKFDWERREASEMP
jgi:hypothetical protein